MTWQTSLTHNESGAPRDKEAAIIVSRSSRSVVTCDIDTIRHNSGWQHSSRTMHTELQQHRASAITLTRRFVLRITMRRVWHAPCTGFRHVVCCGCVGRGVVPQEPQKGSVTKARRSDGRRLTKAKAATGAGPMTAYDASNGCPWTNI